ncbi:MAG: 3-deoxy-manno-octulosonate cytidylyltransferase [Gammaproteobacteria bacterium]|nr:3-deoxy-manno-octulosonate cytidylyltransferase [Gammaproteobacteria bacterium]
MTFKVVIPARFASTRLPGKPLLPILGRPMIQHVHARAIESGAEQIVIATDDERIVTAARKFGADVCLTSSSHVSGTERVAEVCRQYGWSDETVVVNLQGDEPCVPPELLDQVAGDMDLHTDAHIATLATEISTQSELFDPHVVKVVTNGEGYALYFSRAPIPWHRDEFIKQNQRLPTSVAFYRHVGIYAYRAGYIQEYTALQASPLEQAESLEQLRALWYGSRIHVSTALRHPGQGVDTQDDLVRVARFLEGA